MKVFCIFIEFIGGVTIERLTLLPGKFSKLKILKVESLEGEKFKQFNFLEIEIFDKIYRECHHGKADTASLDPLSKFGHLQSDQV